MKSSAFIVMIIGSCVECGVVKELNTECSDLEYRCADGTCVRLSALCDGVADCPQHEDEAQCALGRYSREASSSCSKEEWRCRSGECVSFDSKCDGLRQCADGSDETHALCRRNSCQSNWFRCTYGACVDEGAKCDNVTHCADNSDELHPDCAPAVRHIRNGRFTCSDGTTIPASLVCDGVAECVGADDESVRVCGHSRCDHYLFQCAYGACVNGDAACDGRADCADASDESDELCNRTNLMSAEMPNAQSKCELPPPPEYGIYTVLEPKNSTLSPGDVVDLFRINVTCREGYGFEGDARVNCFSGLWLEQMPLCRRYCKLSSEPSVEYQCLIPNSNGGSRQCRPYEPPGTLVRASCTAQYYALGPQPLMRCVDGSWTARAQCQPDCGTKTAQGEVLVSGGLSARRTEVPWQVAIYRRKDSKHICGGSILTNSRVVSAAHCFWSPQEGAALPAHLYALSAGKLYKSRYDTRDDGAQHSDISEIHIPKQFHGAETHYREDIAMLYVASPFTYTSVVRPVCVDFDLNFEKEQLRNGNPGLVSGWGLVTADGNSTAVLRVVWLPYIDPDTCYELSPEDYRRHISRDKFCAGYTNGTAALCRGDSGGGLSFPTRQLSRSRHYLRGIVSTSPQLDMYVCNTHAPTAFTSLMQHEEFIRTHIAA